MKAYNYNIEHYNSSENGKKKEQWVTKMIFKWLLK